MTMIVLVQLLFDHYLIIYGYVVILGVDGVVQVEIGICVYFFCNSKLESGKVHKTHQQNRLPYSGRRDVARDSTCGFL